MAGAALLLSSMLAACAVYVHVREVVAVARLTLAQLLAWVPPQREGGRVREGGAGAGVGVQEGPASWQDAEVWTWCQSRRKASTCCAGGFILLYSKA
jgi:hypothetical protein